MEQLFGRQPIPVEEIWIKNEPTDNESSTTFFPINYEYETGNVKEEPTTFWSTAEEASDPINIKSEITLGDYECLPAAPDTIVKNTVTKAAKKEPANPRQIIRKSYDCEQCGKSFPQTYGLNRHVRTHSDARPYECDICGARFKQRCHMKQHKLLHTDEKKYFSCSECPLVFATKTTWTVHMLTHSRTNGDDEKKLFSCNECGGGYNRKHSLLRHLRGHFRLPLTKHPKVTSEKKLFPCDECGKIFDRKDSRNRHLLLHTGSRPFECDECAVRFTQRGHLRKHKLVMHRGIKKARGHCCEECGASFATRCNMMKHRLTHAKKKPVASAVKLADDSYSLKRFEFGDSQATAAQSQKGA